MTGTNWDTVAAPNAPGHSQTGESYYQPVPNASLPPVTPVSSTPLVTQTPTSTKTTSALASTPAPAPTATSPAPEPIAPPVTPPEPEVDPNKPVYDILDQLSGMYDVNEQKMAGNLDTTQASQAQTIEANRASQMGQMGQYRTEAEQGRSRSLRDVANNISSSMKAANTYLGMRGAGDSSGADMYGYALGQEGQRLNNNVYDQYTQQISQIQGLEQNIASTADTQINELNTWKNEQLGNLTAEFNAKREQLMSARADIKAQAIADWKAKLDAIESNYTNWQQSIGQWLTERTATLNSAKMELEQSMGGAQPQDIAAGEVRMMSSYAPANSLAYPSYLR